MVAKLTALNAYAFGGVRPSSFVPRLDSSLFRLGALVVGLLTLMRC